MHFENMENFQNLIEEVLIGDLGYINGLNIKL
jgi:hypothetical protein